MESRLSGRNPGPDAYRGTMGDHDRLAVLDQEIRKHRETLETLIRERDTLSVRIGRKTHETDSSS